jgi:hypothetical protein
VHVPVKKPPIRVVHDDQRDAVVGGDVAGADVLQITAEDGPSQRVLIEDLQEAWRPTAILNVGPPGLADGGEAEAVPFRQVLADVWGYSVRAVRTLSTCSVSRLERPAAATFLQVANVVGERDLTVVLAHDDAISRSPKGLDGSDSQDSIIGRQHAPVIGQTTPHAAVATDVRTGGSGVQTLTQSMRSEIRDYGAWTGSISVATGLSGTVNASPGWNRLRPMRKPVLAMTGISRCSSACQLPCASTSNPAVVNTSPWPTTCSCGPMPVSSSATADTVHTCK